MSRKIKDIKDKHTGELVYPRTHVSAVVLSSDSTLEDLVEVKQDKINDLDDIRAGAAKGATALQSYTEQYTGTVTGVKINGTTKNPSSGIVDLGTVITAHQTLKTINGESIVGSGDITISGGGSSGANVQAVDTGDVLDDVAVDYATKTYVDGLVGDINSTLGDINSVLESIINGGGVSLITFTIAGTEYQAENGMTWEQWVNSEYNIAGFYIDYMPWIDTYVIAIDYDMDYGTLPGISISDLILSGYEYEIYYEEGALDPI